MSRKIFTQVSFLALLLIALLAIPAGAQAGGVCGGTYVAEAGDTLNSIATRCGTTVSAINTANPGVSDPLRAGQTLNLSSTNSSGSAVTSTIVSSDTSYTATTTTTTTTTSSNYNNYVAPVTYNNSTYVVQYGDTFAAIAYRYGLSINQLWAANPQVWNINYIYAGQVLYISSGGGTVATSTTQSQPLSYGNVPAGTEYSYVRLVNKSQSKEIYVSLQGETVDGIRVIYEYPVEGSLKVKVPTGNYTYVAWVNEQEFVGYFRLRKGSDRTITFRNSESAAE
jgi:LysM repeat protein